MCTGPTKRDCNRDTRHSFLVSLSPSPDKLKEGTQNNFRSGTEEPAAPAAPEGPERAPGGPGAQGPPAPPRRGSYHVVQLLHNALHDLGFALQQLWRKLLIQPGLQEGAL